LIREEITKYYGIEELEFLDGKYCILKNPKEHLEYFYGKNFMIPDANWTPQKVKKLKFLKNKIGIKVNNNVL
jgi:hypothetical protein